MKCIFTGTAVFILLITACGGYTGVTYSYSDGSNNTLYIENNILEYRPVTPAESSSGTYSGGIAVRIQLSAQDMEQIKEAFEDALADTAAHQENRAMMTGLVKIEGNGKIRTCILRQDSPSKNRIEKLLTNSVK